MPMPFGKNLRSGDISKTTPTFDKAEALAKAMILEAVRLEIDGASALGSAAGFVTYILSHFSDVDRAVVLNGFLQSVQMSAAGGTQMVIPLDQVVISGNSKGAIPLQNRPK